jgi:hypothetical protein
MLARRPPDVPGLLRLLNEHGVRYVVTGSAAAMLHGVDLVPGDLDVTPALDEENLGRLAEVLHAIRARQAPEGAFGDWQLLPDGEQKWVERDPTPEDVAARAAWQPDPANPASFDHLLESNLGAIDVVPEVSGTYDELRPRAVELAAFGERVWVESIEDLLATITIPRREKDADRVRRLRELQREAMVSSTIGRGWGGSPPSS